MKITGKKILVTGGASGIGLGLTERFLNDNNTLIICGRRGSVLNEVKSKYPQVITKTCDLASESERIALHKWISDEHPDLNILVNNAGIQNWMTPTDQDFYSKALEEIE